MDETSTVGKFKFEATGDVVTVLRSTAVKEFRPANGPPSFTKGAKSYRTDTGVELNAASTDESRFRTIDGALLFRVE